MPFHDVNGVSLYYEMAGSGERLLSISGTGGDLRQKPGVADGLVGQAFEVLSYDQRGLGQSSVPPWPYAMADFADDAAALLDAVGWEDCLVLGISFGGMVAQEVAIRHPERVRRLVLACTSAGGAGGASYPLQELGRLEPRGGVGASEWNSSTPGGTRPGARSIPRWSSLIAERMPSGAGEPPAQGLTNQLAARAEHDTSGRLGTIACPTLVCGGRFDGIAPPANSEFLASAIPGAQLEMFDGGHAFFMQDATALPAIVAFLSADAPVGDAP